MPASRRLLSAALVVVATVAGAVFLRSRSAGPTPPPVPARPIVAAIRAEPRSFNRFAAGDRTTGLLAMLLHARLVQLNQLTQDIEPALATKWTLDPDGRTYTLELRKGVAFSDGTPSARSPSGAHNDSPLHRTCSRLAVIGSTFWNAATVSGAAAS